MKKNLFAFLALAALAAACTVNTESADDKIDKGEPSVGFGAYINRGVTTKAGPAGELTTDSEGTVKLKETGFGVFCYYTADGRYSYNAIPNFMYNEKVSYDTKYHVWTYFPIKYWPNQYDPTISDGVKDHLTFFAYAPYVPVTTSSGRVEGDADNGITSLSLNSSSGDPLVRYQASMDPTACVDLCWGVSKNGLTASVDGFNNHVAKGAPYIDVLQLRKGDKIDFEFHHALTALNVQIDAAVDAAMPGKEVDTATRVFVRAVTFEGFTTKGALNLNSRVSDGPNWVDVQGFEGLNTDPVTIYDGRRNGKEGIEGVFASNEKTTGLNPLLVQDRPYSDKNLAPGVTKTAVNLFNNKRLTVPVYVIPTGEPLKVTLVYDVETRDDKLATYLADAETHGSSVDNSITKTIQIAGSDLTLEAGKKYTLVLHIGLTSVKFDASVSSWEQGTSGSADMPQNNN